MTLPARRTLIGLACLFLALPAAAQVFKSTMPDGRVVFGDKPEPNAVRVEELAPESPTGPIDPRQAEEARQRQQREAAEAGRRDKARQAKLDAIDKEIEAAEKDLRAARQRLEEATEPEAGERTGTTGKGRSRLNPDYWERQENLQKEVQKQTERLERARRQRSELAP